MFPDVRGRSRVSPQYHPKHTNLSNSEPRSQRREHSAIMTHSCVDALNAQPWVGPGLRQPRTHRRAANDPERGRRGGIYVVQRRICLSARDAVHQPEMCSPAMALIYRRPMKRTENKLACSATNIGVRKREKDSGTRVAYGSRTLKAHTCRLAHQLSDHEPSTVGLISNCGSSPTMGLIYGGLPRP